MALACAGSVFQDGTTRTASNSQGHFQVQQQTLDRPRMGSQAALTHGSIHFLWLDSHTPDEPVKEESFMANHFNSERSLSSSRLCSTLNAQAPAELSQPRSRIQRPVQPGQYTSWRATQKWSSSMSNP